MNFYTRRVHPPINIYSTIPINNLPSFWANKFTGLPDLNYRLGLHSWNLHRDLFLLRVKELCVKQIWEF